MTNGNKIKPNYVTVITFDLLIAPMIWDILYEFQGPITIYFDICNILILKSGHFQYNIKDEKITFSSHINIYFIEQ